MWAIDLIDKFSFMVANHHRYIRDFKFVSTTLEATSKVYELKVDSVHGDICRLAAPSSKVFILFLKFKKKIRFFKSIRNLNHIFHCYNFLSAYSSRKKCKQSS